MEVVINTLNNLSSRVCVSNKTEDGNVNVFNIRLVLDD